MAGVCFRYRKCALFASSKIRIPSGKQSGRLCSNPCNAIKICCSSACHSIAFRVHSSSAIFPSSLSVYAWSIRWGTAAKRCCNRSLSCFQFASALSLSPNSEVSSWARIVLVHQTRFVPRRGQQEKHEVALWQPYRRRLNREFSVMDLRRRLPVCG